MGSGVRRLQEFKEMVARFYDAGLGVILEREPDGFDGQSGFLKACGLDPVLARRPPVIAPPPRGHGGRQYRRVVSE